MRPNRLQNALAAFGDAMREVNAAIEEMRREHDPLAVPHLRFTSELSECADTKSGKRRDTSARLSWQRRAILGFVGTLANGTIDGRDARAVQRPLGNATGMQRSSG